GGGVEHGETAFDALRRELAEEAGVMPDGAPELFGCYANHANFPNDHVLVYRVHAWRPCPPARGQEIAECGFFALDALPDGVTRGTRARLAELFAEASPRPHW